MSMGSRKVNTEGIDAVSYTHLGGSICHLLEVTAGNTEYANGLLRMNVIDEIILYVVPTIDGNGAHFFKSALPMNDWRLMENKTYRDGVIRLTYHKEPRA